MCNDENGLRKIQTVPERQMQNFIAIAGTEDERVMYLNPDEIDLSKGDKVRVLAGPFEGVEGVFMRVVNGKREKRVVVKIAGVVAIATASLPISLVEKID
jgi:transcription antitermination factor NusG